MIMRSLCFLLASLLTAATSIAQNSQPKDLVAQLYQAHASHHDPLNETALLGRYFDPALLKLYLQDRHQAKEEVGRLDGDPLYNAQDMEIKDFSISPPETAGGETRVTVRFQNLGQPHRLLYILTKTNEGWKISDIRYDDGSSIKKILQAPL